MKICRKLLYSTVFIMVTAALASARNGGPTISVSNLQSQVDLVLSLDPKGAPTTVTVNQNGPVTIPPTLALPADPNATVKYKKCPDGKIYFYLAGRKDPCPAYLDWGSFPWNTTDNVEIDASKPPVAATSVGVPASGAMLPFVTQIDVFSGAGWPEGNPAAKFGGGLAFEYPITSFIAVGPVVYGEYEAGARIGGSGGSSGGTTPDGGVTTFEKSDLRASALFAGARVEVSVTGRVKVDAEGGLFPTWGRVTTFSEVCGSATCTTFASSVHPQNVGGSFGAGAAFELCHHWSVFGRYNRDELNAGGNLNGLNQFSFGFRLGLR